MFNALGEHRNAAALVMRMGTNLTQTSASTAKKSNRSTNKEWKKLIAEYQQPHVGKAVWQIVNTFKYELFVLILFFRIGCFYQAERETQKSVLEVSRQS